MLPEPTWEKAGTEYLLTRAGRPWALRLEPVPGIISADAERSYSILTLAGISTRGQSRPDAFLANSLIETSHLGRVVQATYAPPNPGGLRIRARWSISAIEDAIDLEIEAAASSVGEIFELEVGVRSQVLPVSGQSPVEWNGWITPRDARTAGFSYDGRELASVLQSATTLPIPVQGKPVFLPRIFRPGTPAEPPRHYIEMIQPNDCSRRLIFEPTGPGASRRHAMATRYELFGHDLEKGVVLRARLRALWRTTETPEATALACYEEFLREPLPLGP